MRSSPTKQSVLIAGSAAFDSIKTPHGERTQLLGGSASHAAVAAAFFAPVRLLAVVGRDFPRRYLALYRRRGIQLDGLEVAPGKTFHWAGEYERNMNNRRTLATELGVLDGFEPQLPPAWRQTPFVLLANLEPRSQSHVLDQMEQPRYVMADTMDLWLNRARADLLRLLQRVDALVLNDSEARRLAEEDNVVLAAKKIHRLGPAHVIVKKGEHGAILSSPSGTFLVPAFPLTRLVDPTGAGDSFAGALIGYLASRKGGVDANLRQAMIYGTVVASFCCEDFGLTRTLRLKRAAIETRKRLLQRLIRFW